jgi:hypothetical protein
MRWLLAFGTTTVILAAGVWYQTTKSPSDEGGMECHGVPRGNRCVQFPADPRLTRLVAALPVVRQYRPLTDVRCYAKGTLAVCTGMLNHGQFGVDSARFRVHPDGSATPVCPSKRGKHVTSVFCLD